MLEPEVETRPWDEQLALDDASYREQLAYLFERSAFYREKLAARGSRPRSGRRPRRDRDAAADREGRAEGDRDAREPDRRAPLRRVASSSSGSTRRAARPARRATSRSPPATSRTGSPARRAATPPRGSRPASGSSRPTTRARSSRARRSTSLRADRPLPHPGRDRQHRAAAARDRAPAARGGRADAVVRRPPRSSGRPSAASTCAARASSACSSPASPAAASRRSARSSRTGWGAKVTEAMGIGDIGVSLWGECEEQDGMHLGARGFVHPELIEPESRARRCRSRTAPTGELVLTHLRHRAAPLLRFRTRDHVGSARARARADAPARASAASAARTTC